MASTPPSDPPPPEPPEAAAAAETLGGDVGSLQDLLDAGHRLSASQALLVGLEAARVLMRMHGEGRGHGRVTASNLMFDADGRVRLTHHDSPYQPDDSTGPLLAPGMRPPTHHDSTHQPDDSPGSEADVDPADDVRDLGLVIRQAVTGAATTMTGEVLNLDESHDSDEPRRPDEAPDLDKAQDSDEALRPDETSFDEALGPLRSVVARAVSPRPEDRPRAADLVRDLIRTAESLPRPEPFPLIEPRTTGPSPSPVPAGDAIPGPVPATGAGSGPALPVDAGPGPIDAGPVPAAGAVPGPVPAAEAGSGPALPVDAGPGPIDAGPVPAAEAGPDPSLVPAPAPSVDDPHSDPDPAVSLPGEQPVSPALSSPEAQPGPSAVSLPEEPLAPDLESTPPAADPAPVMAPTAPRPAVPLDDAPRRRWPGTLLAVVVVLAAGIGAVRIWQSTVTEPDAVPDLEGRDRAEAIAEVTALGWAPEVIQVRRLGTEPGEVVDTEPEAGTALEPGRSLRLFVSLGPPLVALPDVVGLSPEAAEVLLAQSGFSVSGQVPVLDDTHPPGTVVGVDLPSWITELEPGAEISLRVSDDPPA